jgi:hypothetical protein
VIGDPGVTFPLGLTVDLAADFGSLGFVAEGGWSTRSERAELDDVTFDFWHAGAGFRWARRRHWRMWPYVQALVGAAFHGTSGQVSGTDQTDTTGYFMLQPGGGVQVVVRDRFGIVAAVDYRRVFLDEGTDGESGLNEIRVFVGVRLTLR